MTAPPAAATQGVQPTSFWPTWTSPSLICALLPTGKPMHSLDSCANLDGLGQESVLMCMLLGWHEHRVHRPAESSVSFYKHAFCASKGVTVVCVFAWTFLERVYKGYKLLAYLHFTANFFEHCCTGGTHDMQMLRLLASRVQAASLSHFTANLFEHCCIGGTHDMQMLRLLASRACEHCAPAWSEVLQDQYLADWG